MLIYSVLMLAQKFFNTKQTVVKQLSKTREKLTILSILPRIEPCSKYRINYTK